MHPQKVYRRTHSEEGGTRYTSPGRGKGKTGGNPPNTSSVAPIVSDNFGSNRHGGCIPGPPPPPNVCVYKLFVGAPGTPQTHVFFIRAPNLGLKKPLFGPWAATQKIFIDAHIKKRAKRGYPPVLGDFWPFWAFWAKISAKPVSPLECKILKNAHQYPYPLNDL